MYSNSQEQWTNSWRLAAAAMRLPSLLTLAGAWASSLCGTSSSSLWYPLCSQESYFSPTKLCVNLTKLSWAPCDCVCFSTSREATFPLLPLSVLFKDATQTNVCKISSPGRGLSSGETVTWVHEEPDPGARIHSRHTEEKRKKICIQTLNTREENVFSWRYIE